MTDIPVLGAPGLTAARPTAVARGLRVLALTLFGFTMASVLTVFVFILTMEPTPTVDLNSSFAVVLQMVGMAGLSVAGTVLAWQRPRTTIAWLMLATALAWVGSYLTLVGAVRALASGHGMATALGWLTNWSWIPAQALSLVMLLRFPTGRLPSRRWRIAE